MQMSAPSLERPALEPAVLQVLSGRATPRHPLDDSPIEIDVYSSLETPQNNCAIVTALGFGDGKASMVDYGPKLAEQGAYVTAHNHVRSGAGNCDPLIFGALTLGRVIDVAIPDTIQRIDTVAHSMGCAQRLRLGALGEQYSVGQHITPDTIGKTILMMPPGFTTRVGSRELTRRALRECISSRAEGSNWDLRRGKRLVGKSALSVLRYLTTNPKLTLKEIEAIARYDAQEDMTGLLEFYKQLGRRAWKSVGIIISSVDGIFPASELEASARQLQEAYPAFVQVRTIKVAHSSFPNHPLLQETIGEMLAA